MAKPVLQRILVKRYSPLHAINELRKRIPEIMTHAPDMPRLVHAWLKQQVDGQHELSMRSKDLAALNLTLQRLQRRVVTAIGGAGLLVVAAVLHAFGVGGPSLWGVPLWTWFTGALGTLALLSSWLRR